MGDYDFKILLHTWMTLALRATMAIFGSIYDGRKMRSLLKEKDAMFYTKREVEERGCLGCTPLHAHPRLHIKP